MSRLTALATFTLSMTMASVALAQTAKPASEADAIAALTAELRALRAELAENARVSLRLQLLTARIQAQEQRIIYLDRQRTDAAARRLGHEQVVSAIANSVPNATAEALANVAPEERRAMQQHAEQQKRELTRQQEILAEFRVQETDAESALAQEQARWGDLNTRLEQLEQSLR